MQEPRFKNVALLPKDHELLRQISEKEQRAMTRQLSVLIRQASELLATSASAS